MTYQKRKKISNNGELIFFNNTAQNPEDLSSLARILASLIIGIQPYLDISMLQLMLEDVLAEPLNEENAQAMGEEIAKRCRVTLPTDGMDGIH
jgi:hypothetical protein